MRAALVLAAALTSGCHHDEAAAPPRADSRIAVAVDPRVELFAILERLAGSPEYTRAATPYAAAVDAWFAPVKDDPAVAAFRQLRASNGISYDAALTLAVQLDAALQPVRPLAPLPDGVDARWQGVDLVALLGQVRAFAEASRFAAFRAGQTRYDAEVEGRLRTFVGARSLVTWFDAAFGARAGAKYKIAPGLLTGQMNYGLHATPLDIEEVIFLEAPDAAGLPTYGPISEALLAHELAHSYINPIIHAHVPEVSGAATALDAAALAMAKQHYTTREIVADEALVRAVTVIYLRDQVSSAAAAASLAEQQQLGFAWTPALVAALDRARAAHGGTWTAADLLAAYTEIVGLAARVP